MIGLRTMHLFAGAGGGLYADLILGHKPIVAAEWDAYACAVLRSRAADGWFPGLQVWEGDVRLFDPSEYAGKVDCIHAGFPCTDISTAGRGEGINGQRSGLYREILRVADIVRPRFLFLENSPAITCRGLGQVLGELAERGYNAKWTVLSAGEVGANHERARWWCAAERNVPYSEMSRNGGRVGDVCEKNGRQNGELFQQFIQPAESLPISEHGWTQEKREASGTVEFHTDTKSSGLERINKSTSSGQSSVARVFSEPARMDREISNTNSARRKEQRIEKSNEAKLITDECCNWWQTEPNLGRLANGVAAISHQLKCLGNGQVPICAAAAWKILTEY